MFTGKRMSEISLGGRKHRIVIQNCQGRVHKSLGYEHESEEEVKEEVGYCGSNYVFGL